MKSAGLGHLSAALHYVLAIGLCILGVIGMALRGQSAIAALSWGWADIAIPITSELKHRNGVNYGVYDPFQRFSEARGVAIEHIFVSWLSSESSEKISVSFKYASDRNRWLMITVEPFPLAGREPQLLTDVAAGAYDLIIASLCKHIGSLQAPALVRWGHEMETTDVRYPWSGADNDSYIAAYRHFAEKCRADAPKIYFVWSPKGARGLAKYYPGRTFVDLVGLSIYELPAYDLDHSGNVIKFRDTFTPKYDRVIVFNSPVIIAEMGVSGDPIYQAHWMADFFRSASNFPLLRTAVYFNGKDNPSAWPEKYGTPDWTIDPNIFE
jgi:cellulose synthase (UDP-forming)